MNKTQFIALFRKADKENQKEIIKFGRSLLDHNYDPNYEAVCEYARTHQEFSISRLFRALNIGYGHIGRLLETLEKEGVIIAELSTTANYRSLIYDPPDKDSA